MTTTTGATRYDIAGTGHVADGGHLAAEADTMTPASSHPARQPGSKTRP